MLSQVMLIVQAFSHGLCGGMDGQCEASHPRQRFQNHRVVRGRFRIFSPGERSVVGHQHARGRRRIGSAQ